jgi:hypothetical protein
MTYAETLEQKKAARLDALNAVIERADVTLADGEATNQIRNDARRRKMHAEREIEHIETFGYAYPFNSGYPVC